jgi:alpha,alpha-trehalase
MTSKGVFNSSMIQSESSPVVDYIRANFPRSFYQDANGSGFKGDDLPFRYTSPCIQGEGKFSFFFYWDTYFTHLGLLRCGHADVARDNLRNMLWLIERQGYMPNHSALFNRSQSPYLCRMVRDYFEHLGGPDADPDFFRACLEGLRREYQFWTLARLHPTGLSHHGHSGTWEDEEAFAANKRVTAICPNQHLPLAERRRIGAHYLAEAEATCDFTPRFQKRCIDFIQPDLNGLLYEYECLFAEHAERLGWNTYRDWQSLAEARRTRIQQLLWSEERGLYLDYDHVNHRHSPVAALTGLQLLAHGIPTPEQAARIVANLPLFEREHGIAYTEECPGCRDYQWAFPAVWPPMVWMTVEGLDRYGYREDARRIAGKFIATTDWLFEKYGKIFEKTDAETGELSVADYVPPPMMGWSAGVYLRCRDAH